MKKINLIFLGDFPYPSGMAGTRRILHAIDALKVNPDVIIRVIILRQSSNLNSLSGTYKGVPYETILGDAVRAKFALFLPLLYFKCILSLHKAWCPDCINIIYNYGPIALENCLPLYYARWLGYKIVFDITEDHDAAMSISHSFYHRVKTIGMMLLANRVKNLASGIIIISSRLEKKYSELTQRKIPIHYKPISVDMTCFPVKAFRIGSPVILFYAGSFGKKDGLPVLLDAFDKLASKRNDIRLVLSGQGGNDAMKEFSSRMEMSPYKDRIDYKGYLDSHTYYSLLNSIDIPCMTRTDTPYAHAGFPFKLGEFLATGKPVVASEVSDVEQFLVDNYSAMLVPPDDPNGICDAIEYLLDNPDKSEAIGRQGREAAKLFFDYQMQGKALLSFLRNL